MLPNIGVGTVLINDSPLIMRFFGLESEACSGLWSLVKLDGYALDRKIHAEGWNFFFMAAEIKGMFLGVAGARKIQNALTRILAKVRKQHFNSIEVTGIVFKRFLGVPYTVVLAHSRHIQQSCQLDDVEGRRRLQRDSEWANG